MAITATHLNDGIASPQATLSVTPTGIGNCIIFSILVVSTTIFVTSLSGGGVTNWTKIYSDTTFANGAQVSHFIGKVTATGAQTITPSYSSAIGTTTTEVVAYELSDGASRDWLCVAISPPMISPSGTTIFYPILEAPMSGGDVQYHAYTGIATGGTDATVGSFTQTNLTDGNGNAVLTGNVANGVRAVPTGFAQGLAGVAYVHAVLVQARLESWEQGVTQAEGGFPIAAAKIGDGYIGAPNNPNPFIAMQNVKQSVKRGSAY